MSGYQIAKRFKGKHENVHTRELNAYILKYVPAWRGLSVDSTPWCAAIMGAWEKEAGNLGTGLLNARSYLKYGKTVYDRDKRIGSLKDVKSGDIAIFERGGSTSLGHVAYVDGVEFQGSRTLIRTLGGNQSDSVSIGWYPASRLLRVCRP